ncbi:amino acid ABC transporter permease [Paenibacillus eucommiae]|uniref:Polar amino acid transport system permease protein n=1 Tax=Paenibacillus eucommiae TaxID=1355755 RepID=A0ABS4ISC1_9BACL|nr:amino acid ABC transporter permease [Paenibacillus eucommiae]MBP1990458.1 polar amino acid transport system permease protein [Paenibacillus eucommiae]
MQSFDFSVLFHWETISLLLRSLWLTILYTCASFVLAIGIGTVIAFGQISKFKPWTYISLAYLSWFRGTPLLVQLFLLYYGLPMVFKIDTVPWMAGVIALAMYSGAYASQIIRGAIQSIDKGQMEAGRSLGFSYAQTMSKIIIPQAAIRMLAPMTNELISLTKNSSLLSTITVVELFRQANLMIADTYKTMEFLLAIAVLYYLINNLIGYLGLMLERRLSMGDDIR